MPHLTLEYSANLADADVRALCRTLADTLHASGMFERGAVRVRAVRCEAYLIADGDPDNAFVDMIFRVGTGRSPEALHGIGEALFAAASAHLSRCLARPHFALSLEVREIDPSRSWKANTMHQRFRATVPGRE